MGSLEVLELHKDAFDVYGQIITIAESEPLAKNADFTYWDKISCLQLGENVSTGILEVAKRELSVSTMERHMNTIEVIISLCGDSVIVVGKPSCGDDSIEEIKAFSMKQGEGVVLKRGVWHWAPYPIHESARFLIMFAEGTPEKDCFIKEVAG